MVAYGVCLFHIVQLLLRFRPVGSRTLKGKTQLSTQIKFYKVMAVPVLMYGSENWVPKSIRQEEN